MLCSFLWLGLFKGVCKSYVLTACTPQGNGWELAEQLRDFDASARAANQNAAALADPSSVAVAAAELAASVAGTGPRDTSETKGVGGVLPPPAAPRSPIKSNRKWRQFVCGISSGNDNVIPERSVCARRHCDHRSTHILALFVLPLTACRSVGLQVCLPIRRRFAKTYLECVVQGFS